MSIVRDSYLADAVLAYLGFHSGDDTEFQCEGYENGREHGYCVRLSFKHGNSFDDVRYVCFAEYRRSDDIVVYCFKSCPEQGNLLTDDVYDNHSHFFNYSKASEAAKFIIDFLKTGNEAQKPALALSE